MTFIMTFTSGFIWLSQLLAIYLDLLLILKQYISREFLVGGIKLKGEKLLKNKLSWAIWTIQ